MEFSWNDYIVIKDGITADIAEQKKMQSVTTVTNTFLASYFGMGKRENKPDLSFPELLGEFGLDEQGKAEKSDSSENTQKNIQQSQRLLEQVFEGDE